MIRSIVIISVRFDGEFDLGYYNENRLDTYDYIGFIDTNANL